MKTPAEKWPDVFLAEMRHVGDPLADDTVAALFERGNIESVNALLMTLVQNEQMPDEGADPVVRNYLRATSSVPDMDASLVHEMGELFRNHGNLALFALVCASLPECYVLKKGVHVLWVTQRLKSHVLRRLLETAHMVMRVMSPGGLASGGAGLRTAAKVRLMHAAIRRLIVHGHGRKPVAPPERLGDAMMAEKWDLDYLGTPINQMDLAYTLLTFSYVLPRSLEKLGLRMSHRQKEAFVHSWNVVGKVMGLRDDLLAASYEEAQWLFERIKVLEGGESDAGKEMTAAVIRCMQDAIPGPVLDFLPVLLMCELLDEKTRAMLGVQPPGPVPAAAQLMLASNIRGATWLKQGTQDYLVLTPQIWEWVAGYVTIFLTNFGQPPGWQRQMFSIPEEMAKHWKLPTFT